VQSAKPVQSKTAEQSLTDIGDVRRELFLSGTHKWNGVVRDVTAKLEHPGMLVDKIEVLKALATRLTNEALANELAASLHSNPELTTLREIYAGMSEFIEAAETMMEFLPVYSVSSAGHQRKERLKQAIQKLRGVLA